MLRCLQDAGTRHRDVADDLQKSLPHFNPGSSNASSYILIGKAPETDHHSRNSLSLELQSSGGFGKSLQLALSRADPGPRNGAQDSTP